MPLLKAQTKIEIVKQKFELSKEVKEDLAHYSRMIESEPDYIVEQALALLFKDKAFANWKRANLPNAGPSEMPKVKAIPRKRTQRKPDSLAQPEEVAAQELAKAV